MSTVHWNVNQPEWTKRRPEGRSQRQHLSPAPRDTTRPPQGLLSEDTCLLRSQFGSGGRNFCFLGIFVFVLLSISFQEQIHCGFCSQWRNRRNSRSWNLLPPSQWFYRRGQKQVPTGELFLEYIIFDCFYILFCNNGCPKTNKWSETFVPGLWLCRSLCFTFARGGLSPSTSPFSTVLCCVTLQLPTTLCEQGREGTWPHFSGTVHSKMGLLGTWNPCSVSMQGNTVNSSKKEWSIYIGYSVIKPIEAKC